MSTTELSTKRPEDKLRELIESDKFKNQIAPLLPDGVTPARFVRVTLTSALKNPKILKCSRDSLLRCLLEICSFGLEPDGRRAHLIPRLKNKGKPNESLECTYIIDYKGLKELFFRNHDIVDEHSDVVREGDHFICRFGSNKLLEHEPLIKNKGTIYAAYAHVTLPGGGQQFDVMNSDEIEAVRHRSLAAEDGPWVTDWPEMSKKTVFRRLAKSIPLSQKSREVLEKEDEMIVVDTAPVRATVATQVSKGSDLGTALENGQETTTDETTQKPADETLGKTAQQSSTQPADKPPESTAEPVSGTSKEETAESPYQRVLGLLKESAFSEGELIVLLKEVKLCPATLTDLSKAPNKAFDAVLAEWDNVILRLGRNRQPPAPATSEPEERDRSEV
ncbi:MAG TPA: recombinase RecT [Chthoniobacterales bacterium]|nr:recombinase RecT [Chthoniobacterales bacterium]